MPATIPAGSLVPGRQIGLLIFANASGNGKFGEFR